MSISTVGDGRWFSEREFQQALAVGQAMPGPLAAQAAMWFSYLQAGARGAAAVAGVFVLPPFVIVTAVAVLYAEYQGLDWVLALFLGVGPAVLAIIVIDGHASSARPAAATETAAVRLGISAGGDGRGRERSSTTPT